MPGPPSAQPPPLELQHCTRGTDMHMLIVGHVNRTWRSDQYAWQGQAESRLAGAEHREGGDAWHGAGAGKEPSWVLHASSHDGFH